MQALRVRGLFLYVCVCLCSALLAAQEVLPETGVQPLAAERSLKSLETIAEPLAAALSQVDKLRATQAAAASADVKQEIQVRIDSERERADQLREDFRSILGGSEAAEYGETSFQSASVQDQITELVQPILSEIRDATSAPRELDALRKSLAGSQERKRKADTVLDRIDRLKAASQDSTLIAELESARRLWASRRSAATSQIAVASVQIEERTRDQRSVWEKLSSGFSSFFKSRGMNLFFAVLAAGLGFFITRKVYSSIRRFSPVHKKDKNNFTSRISDVLAMAVACCIAIAGIVLVFYVRGDWLLLTLVVIFLIGVAWAGKTAIPPYLDQIRMILNLGSVREGERVIYAGLPWRVKHLGFYTTFSNPNLMGGELRIPIQKVMEMVSRPMDAIEPWFPSEVNDWVMLSDNTYGKIIVQSPDQVVVLQLGGAKKTFATEYYLEFTPLNLSHGFRITVTFGIDYRHQAECTSEIPGIFEEALTKALIHDYGRDAVRSIKVEFASASASSLDYDILADFDGAVAPRYNPLKRKINSVCIDTCNENGWNVPFTQITVHQAEI